MGGPKDGRSIPPADSQDGTLNGFHMLSVDGNHDTTRSAPAVGKGTGQLRAVIDSHLPATPVRLRAPAVRFLPQASCKPARWWSMCLTAGRQHAFVDFVGALDDSAPRSGLGAPPRTARRVGCDPTKGWYY
jgi:hypothetical protein